MSFKLTALSFTILLEKSHWIIRSPCNNCRGNRVPVNGNHNFIINSELEFTGIVITSISDIPRIYFSNISLSTVRSIRLWIKFSWYLILRPTVYDKCFNAWNYKQDGMSFKTNGTVKWLFLITNRKLNSSNNSF